MANPNVKWCGKCGKSYRSGKCPYCEEKEETKEKKKALDKLKNNTLKERVRKLEEKVHKLENINKETPVFRRTPKY